MARIVAKKHPLITMGFLSFCIVCLAIYLVPPMLTSTWDPPREDAQPDWSPDGQRLVYVCYIDGPTEGESLLEVAIYMNPPMSTTPWSHYTADAADLCIIDVGGRNHKRLTQEPGKDWSPVWSPDGRTVAYLRNDGIYVINADENAQKRLIWSGTVHAGTIAWSPDGTHLLFSACKDSSDLDVYLVNIKNGVLTNLTPHSRWHDINPTWTLNGSKVFFLSTVSSSLEPGSCDLLQNDAPYQMKLINADGSGEQVIFKELYYPLVTISNGGQVAFISDMTSKTQEEYLRGSNPVHLYTMRFEDPEPVKLSSNNITDRVFIPSVRPWWSPDGKYLLYLDERQEFKIQDMETGETRELPSIRAFSDPEEYSELEQLNWSPDSQQIAVTNFLEKGVSRTNTPLFLEKHIFLIDLQNGTARPLIQK